MTGEEPRRARIFEPGTKLREYVIQGLLGTGGMAEVYDAIDTRTGSAVAIKVLQTRYQSNPKVRERAIQEGQALARLSHENLVRVLDVGLHGDSVFFIAMERLRGRTLASLVQNEGALPVGVVLTIAQQIADGVHTLHLSNTVHRDLKPANVFISRVDGSIRAKILDLGAVKVLDKHGLTSEGSTIGTVTYMAPEQTYGERIGFYTDVYAIGLMLFEMLAGVHPGEAGGKRGTKEDWLNWQRFQEAPSLKGIRPELPDMLVRLVDQCLRKEGSERAPSGGRLAIELRAIEDVLRRQGRLGSVALDGWSDEERVEDPKTKPDYRLVPAGAEHDRRLPYASTQETLAVSLPAPKHVDADTDEMAPLHAGRHYDTTPDALAAVHTAHGVPPSMERPLPQPVAALNQHATTSVLGASPTAPLVSGWRQVGPAPDDLKPQGKRRPFTERLQPGPIERPSVPAETPQGVVLPQRPIQPMVPTHIASSAAEEDRFGSSRFLLLGVLLGLLAVIVASAVVLWKRAHPSTEIPMSATQLISSASPAPEIAPGPSSTSTPTDQTPTPSSSTSATPRPATHALAPKLKRPEEPSPPPQPSPSASSAPRQTTIRPKWIADPSDELFFENKAPPAPSASSGWKPNW